jgi:hypothetical protein
MPKITQNKNKIIYPQITQINADFKNKKILENQILTPIRRSLAQEKSFYPQINRDLHRLLRKKKLPESVIHVSPF